MKLVHKNFFYTAIITSILTILVLGYFIFMLPSLYVDYMSEENYNAIVKQHNGYLKNGSYQDLDVKNPNGMTVELPLSDNSVIVSGKTFQTTLKPNTEEMRALLLDIKSYAKSQIQSAKEENQGFDEEKFSSELQEKISEWKDIFLKESSFLEELPFDIGTVTDTSDYSDYFNESTKIHFYSENTIFLEAGVEDGENHYTIYIGLTFDSEKIVLSYLPTMTPQINEITPIIIRSLPMLIAVIVFFALIVSHLYSKGMVDPILDLVKHTQLVKQSGDIANASLEVKGKDEIAMLVQTLNELYKELHKNYQDLENSNRELSEKNKRQEVFLRSSSHQLKTPIAAALLLIEGMLNQIGKYKDTKVYLPEVKTQLLSMRKIVEDILYLSRCEENMTIEAIDINQLVNNQLICHQFALEEGNYTVNKKFEDNSFVTGDGNLLSKIIDNLISNGIVHSQKGATIEIFTRSNQLEIFNSHAHIEESLLPNIFEPFVRGSQTGKGHGLGLYIVNYYANILGGKVSIINEKNGVRIRVVFDSLYL